MKRIKLLWVGVCLSALSISTLYAQVEETHVRDTVLSYNSDIEVTDLELDNESEVQEIATILGSSQDAFSSVAAYTFSPMRFRVRGYDSQYSDTYLNGIQMNDMITGYGVWSLWGGLNDAVRGQESMVGVETGNFAFGNIGGVTNVNTRASSYRPGTRLTYSSSNRTYANRAMVTYATGLMNNGMAVMVSASRRWGERGYVEGVFYDANSLFISIEKRFNPNHTISFTALAAPTQRGVASGTTQEAYDLAGSNFYNPNVGYVDGKLRNARVRDNFEPVIVANHYWQITEETRLTSSLGVRFGKNGYSALNWHDAPDPRPDYYRNLPSYYSDPLVKASILEKWAAGDETVKNVYFKRLYNVNMRNQTSVYDYETQEEIANGKRSKYIIEDRRTDQTQLNLNFVINSDLSDVTTLNGGVKMRFNRTENFKTIKDLMGGEFWYDIDQFAERDFSNDPSKYMNDLDVHGVARIKHQGDRYGYDYTGVVNDVSAWAAVKSVGYKIDYYAAAEAGYFGYYRVGHYRKGLFPENSLGESEHLSFTNLGLKAGVTYKITGRHYLTANGAALQRAPYFRNAFISPRTRNTAVKNLTEEKILALDVNYILRAPTLKARATLFMTSVFDQADIMSFYDDYYQSFSNYVMTGIDISYKGLELGAEWKISSTLTMEGALALGDYHYTSYPDYVQTVDNTESLVEQGQVYWSQMKISGTPQLAANLNLEYRSPKYWFVGVGGSYFDRLYIDPNPKRYTDKAIGDLGFPGQEKFEGGFLMDAFVGYSLRIKYKYYLAFNLNVSNILDETNLKSGGYEYLRIGVDSDTGKLNKPFDPRYFYAYGRNYFLNINFRF